MNASRPGQDAPRSSTHDGPSADPHEAAQRASPSGAPGPPVGEEALPAALIPRLLTTAHLHGRGDAPLRQAALLQLQRLQGNRATRRLVQRLQAGLLSAPVRPPAPAAPRAIQRQLLLRDTEASPGATHELLLNLNHLFAGRYSFQVDEHYELTYDEIGEAAVHPVAERFIQIIDQIITAESATRIWLTQNDATIPLASFEGQAVDVTDILAHGGPNMRGMNALTVLAHEWYEQFHKQAAGAGFDEAHGKGIEAENYVSGATRLGDMEFDRQEHEADHTISAVYESLYVYPSADEEADQTVVVLASRIMNHNHVQQVNRHNVTQRVRELTAQAPVAGNLDAILEEIPELLINGIITTLHHELQD